MKQMELLSIRKLSTKHRKVYRMVSLLTLAGMLVSISIVASPIATAELQSAQPSEGQSDKQAQPKSPKQNQPQGQREKTGGEQRQPRQEKARKGGEASPVSEQGAIPPPPPLPPEERAQPPTGAPPAGLPPEFAGRVIRDEKIRVEFSFVKTEIEHVIQFFSKVTGKVFVLHPQLEGTVTIIAPTPLTIDQAFDVLSAVLHVRGFAMIGGIKDPIIKIVPLSEAKTQATDVRTDAQKPVAPEAKKTKEQPEHKARRLVPADRLVTQVIPLKHVSAKQLQQELTPLVSSQNALITSTTAGNLLIITDTERNVERLMQIVRMVDVGMAEAMELAIIPLKYADAQQLARILSQLFSVLGGMPMQQRQQGRQRPPGAPRPSRPQERGRQPTATPTSLQLSVQIVAEPRTNSLIVWASKERMKQVRELVKQLDVETTEVLDVEVIPLQHADATEIERILSEIFEPPTVPAGRPGSGPAPMIRMPLARPGEQPSRTALSAYATITADPRTNSLVVAATAEKMQIIKALVEKLDIDITPPIEVEIIPLKYADATSMAEIIQTLFEEGLGGAGLSPEMRTRLRIYRYYSRIRQRGGTATRSKGEMEQQVVVTADERANALVVAATRENIDRVKKIVEQLDKEFAPPVTARVFKLQYADAAQVADMLNQLFEQTPGGQRGFPFFFGMRRGVTQRERMLGLRENVVEADVRTNSVIVTATDENMREFERLIRELDQPAKLTNLIRIFKIQNVDAVDLADTINSILAQQRRPTGFFFFIFSAFQRQFQGPLRNLQDISVTADPKTNSLIVTAPPYAFDVVEQLVEQLDTVLPQVFIEVMIVDVTLTKELSLGVEWTVMQRKIFGEQMDSTLGTNFGIDRATAQGLRWEVISQNFQAFLQMLAKQDKVNIIATPHILTLDNTPASITIGQSYPVPRNVIITTTGPQYTIDFVDIAITLQVTPHINNNNSVLMDIVQTINEITGTLIQQGQVYPLISRREANASVQVQNGQTVVIGGILRHRISKLVQGIPILKDLPLIGPLFRTSQKIKERTELMVFITPHIIRTGAELQELTQQKRSKLKYPKEFEPLQSPTNQVPEQLEQQQGAQQDAEQPARTKMPSQPATRRERATPARKAIQSGRFFISVEAGSTNKRVQD